MSTPEVHASPTVRAIARDLGVDLADVAGTGVGGRIKPEDVRAAAPVKAPRPRSVAASTARASKPTLKITAQSRFRARTAMGSGTIVSSPTVEVDVFGPNPLLEEMRAAVPEQYAAARKATDHEAPTLFTAGDLPLFTTAGFDPANLLGLPWIARHAAARVSGEKASEIFDRYGEASVQTWNVAMLAFGTDAGVEGYYKRFNGWASAGANALLQLDSAAMTEALQGWKIS